MSADVAAVFATQVMLCAILIATYMPGYLVRHLECCISSAANLDSVSQAMTQTLLPGRLKMKIALS